MPKKSKSDVFRSAINCYLRQKSYVGERYRRSDFVPLQNKREMFFQKMQDADLQRANNFTFSNNFTLTNNHQVVEQQFGRFTQFVESQSECIRLELRRLYGPMLAHFYIELLKAHEENAAMELLKKYAHLIGPVEIYETSASGGTTTTTLPTNINGCTVSATTTTTTTTTTPSSDVSHEGGSGSSGSIGGSGGSGSCSGGGGSGGSSGGSNINNSINSIQLRFINSNLRDGETSNNESSEPDSEFEYFANLLQTLANHAKLETAEIDDDIIEFRASKYEFHTTVNVAQTLIGYLEKKGHILILNLLHTWIHIHLLDHEELEWNEDSMFFGNRLDDMELVAEDTMKVEQKPKIQINTTPPLSSSAQERMKRSAAAANLGSASTLNKMHSGGNLETNIEKMETDACDGDLKNTSIDIPVCLDALKTAEAEFLKTHSVYPRFLKLADRGRGLTSAHLDVCECHMAAGFNNSTIQIWQLNQQVYRGRQLYKRLSDKACAWELNNCHKIEDDPIDWDIYEHAKQMNKSIDRQQRKYYERKYAETSFNEFAGLHLRGHRLGITDVRFSARYPLLFSTSKDTTIRAWNAENYNCVSIYRGHRYPIWCMDESPVGSYLATGSRDLSARLWCTEREFPLITFIGHSQDVESIGFHPNGNYLATGSADLSVRLWCVTSGKVMRIFPDAKQAVTSVTFSPDGKMLAVGGEESKVRIFDLAAGSQLYELKDHSANVNSIAWHPNSRQLATVCNDGSCRIWNLRKSSSSSSSTHDSFSNPSSNTTTTTPSSSSSGSSSTSSSPHRIMTLNSNYQRLVKVFYGQNETVCCIGT